MSQNNSANTITKNDTIPFKVVSEYKPSGDQPKAIKKLVGGAKKDDIL